LSANAMALRQDDLTTVLVALDVGVLSEQFIRDTQCLFEKQNKVPASHLLIHSTHTHVAPAIYDLIRENGTSPEYVARVQEKLLEAAATAIKNLEPVQLFAGCGHLEMMGWNRRAVYEDGSARMYGNSEDPGFVQLEGPRDPQLPVLFAKNQAGKIIGVLVNFSSHPNSIEDECRYSADFPGEARRLISNALDGANVVYITGAAGNTAPSILDPVTNPQPWRGEEGLIRSGRYIAGEALKTIAETIVPMDSPQLQLKQTTLQIPLKPWPEEGESWYPQGQSWAGDFYEKSRQEWPERLKTQSPEKVNINVLQMGDAVLCASPSELFVEFGLEIKEFSPAKVTFISELTDGYAGYIPTAKAYQGGGYETWPAISSRLSLDTGDQIVEETKVLLRKLSDK
ncbi:MAG: hypothetical protein ABI210_04505, partial [Abditibacteriaceae bacterium]